MIQEEKLIFIISQPRSGSTLLQKLISNNSYVDTVSEPWLLLPLLSVYKPSLIQASYNYPVALKGFFDYLDKRNAAGEFKDSLKTLILSLYKVASPEQYFVDKTPRYYEITEEIYELFPKAKYLVLKRNPFGSLHSMITTWSENKIKTEHLKNFYRDFLIGPFEIQKFSDKHGDSSNVLEVKYEDIVSDPSVNVKRIYDWLGIPFSEKVLEIAGNEKVKGIYGDDVYKKEPLKEIRNSQASSWKESNFEKSMAAFFEGYQDYLTKDFIEKYGYAPETFSSGIGLFKNKPFDDFIAYLKSNQLL